MAKLSPPCTVLYVGWDSRQTSPPIGKPAPKNLVDPVKINAHYAAERQRMQAITDIPGYSALSEVVVLYDTGATACTASGPGCAVTFFDAVVKLVGADAFRKHGGAAAPVEPPRVVFVGFSLCDMLRIAALEAIKSGRNVPAGFWVDPPTINPYHECLTAEDRAYVSVRRFAKSLGIDVAPGDDANDNVEPTTYKPAQQADLAFRLAKATALVPPFV